MNIKFKNILVERGAAGTGESHTVDLNKLNFNPVEDYPVFLNCNFKDEPIGVCRLFAKPSGLYADFKITSSNQILLDTLFPALNGQVILPPAESNDKKSGLVVLAKSISLNTNSNQDKGIFSLGEQILQSTIQNRRGMVKISRSQMFGFQFSEYKVLFENFFPIFIDESYSVLPDNIIRYIGFSKYFAELAEGEACPEYEFIFEYIFETNTVVVKQVNRLTKITADAHLANNQN